MVTEIDDSKLRRVHSPHQVIAFEYIHLKQKKNRSLYKKAYRPISY